MTQEEAIDEVASILVVLAEDQDYQRKVAVMSAAMMTYCIEDDNFERFMQYFIDGYDDEDGDPSKLNLITQSDLIKVMRLALAQLDPAGLVELLTRGDMEPFDAPS